MRASQASPFGIAALSVTDRQCSHQANDQNVGQCLVVMHVLRRDLLNEMTIPAQGNDSWNSIKLESLFSVIISSGDAAQMEDFGVIFIFRAFSSPQGLGSRTRHLSASSAHRQWVSHV